MALRDKHLAEGESIVLDMRTHWKALAEPLALLVFLAAVTWLAWWLARDSDYATWVLLIVGGLALVATALFVVIPIWRWNSSRYVFTNRRVSHRTGILTKRGRDIPLYRINDVSIEKGPIDRIFGCGTLIISDATDKAGMELSDVPRVESVQVQLQNLLYQTDDGSDDGEFPPGEPRRPRGG
jgi:membrane protein YdbS with pleckstrin-like domain